MYHDAKTNFMMTQGRFLVKLAEDRSELEKALKLRFEVFNLELKKGLAISYLNGMDTDEYDKYCAHLIVIDADFDRVVGTYRLLPGFVAEFNVGYYSENEFDMTNIKNLQGEKLELGRSCVHRDYRNAQVINLLWAGIARYVELYNIRYLFGCASLCSSVTEEVSLVYSYLSRHHPAEPRYSVYPLQKVTGLRMLQVEDRREALKMLPPLIKGYTSLGANICGKPSYDAIFGTADFFVLLQTEKIMARYRKKYFQEQEEALCPVS
ncbi:MAG: GNAT family N-acetyltransferase [Thermodesulfovibrionales bacterium]